MMQIVHDPLERVRFKRRLKARVFKLVRVRDLMPGMYVDCRVTPGLRTCRGVVTAYLGGKVLLAIQAHPERRFCLHQWLVASPETYVPVLKFNAEGERVNVQI